MDIKSKAKKAAEKAAKDAEITRENEMLNKYSSALTSLNVVVTKLC